MESVKRKERRRMKKAVEVLMLNTSTGVALLSSDIEMTPDDQLSYGNIGSFSNTFTSYNDFVCSSDGQVKLNNMFQSPVGEKNNRTMLTELANWVSKHRLSSDATNKLIKLPSTYGLKVPKDSRMLLKTVDVVEKVGGTYIYLDILDAVTRAVEHLKRFENISLTVNVDGLPLSKSQVKSILGSINNSNFLFLIALFMVL